MRPARALAKLAAVAAAGIALIQPGTGAAAVGDCTPAGDWATARDDLSHRVVELVNGHRAGLRLRPLVISPTLTGSAKWKALHMARYSYMEHADPAPPVARSVGERLAACGYPGAGWGENIGVGYASADSVVQAWLDSPGHRANIENPSFVVIGVGAAARDGGALYWAQSFGTLDDSLASVPVPPPGPPAPGPPAPPVAEPVALSEPQRPLETPVGPAVSAAGSAVLGRQQVVAARVVARRPRAGRRFTARAAVIGAPARPVGVVCRAAVGARRLAAVERAFRGNRAVCTWHVPRSAKGKRLRGAIGVRGGGAPAVRRFARSVG